MVPDGTTLNLKQQEVHEQNGKFLENHYPALRHFGIANTRGKTYSGKIDNGNLEKFFALNPQLMSLWITSDDMIDLGSDISYGDYTYDGWDIGIEMHGKLLAFANEKLPNLETLHLIFENRDMIEPASEAELCFRKLKNLIIELEESNSLNGMPISSENIDTLSLSGSRLDDGCSDLIRNNKNAKIIKFIGKWNKWGNKTAIQMIKLFPTLPNLSELQIPYQEGIMMPKHIINLLTDCKMLRKLVISAKDIERKKQVAINKIYDDIIAIAGADWKGNVIIPESMKMSHYSSELCLFFEKKYLID